MSDRAIRRRLLRPAVIGACLIIAGSSAVLAQDTSAVPSPSGASPTPSLPAASFAPASPAPAYLPLPAQFQVPADADTVSVGPESAPGTLTVGTAVAFTLGHCGLYSPVDLDGSLWQPLGGHDAAGGAIDSDAEIGELINETRGELVLLTPDTAEFRSFSGVVVGFARAPGELDYGLCM